MKNEWKICIALSVCSLHGKVLTAVNMESIWHSNVDKKQGEHRLGTPFASVFLCFGKEKAHAQEIHQCYYYDIMRPWSHLVV